VLPINTHVIGTMAGGAADCMIWIRRLRCEAALHELTEGRRMSVVRAAHFLSNFLYQYREYDLSIGTMIMGFDDSQGVETPPKIFYIDNTGIRIEGDVFAVGSGSILALGILDTERRFNMTNDEAIALGIKAIRHSTLRDAYSGGFINVYLITAKDGWRRVFTEDLDQMASVNYQ
jgi:20S proteasome subunit beta 5